MTQLSRKPALQGSHEKLSIAIEILSNITIEIKVFNFALNSSTDVGCLAPERQAVPQHTPAVTSASFISSTLKSV